MNTFGQYFRFTSFGESHGEAIGGVVDGCPANLPVDMDFVQRELDRRRPGQTDINSQRCESDRLEILSGIFDGHTTGAPIGFIIRNENQRSADYEALREVFRPSHADYTYQQRYGLRDYRGGGRSSARETAARVAAGALAKLWLKTKGIAITAYTSQVGNMAIDEDYTRYDMACIWQNAVHCPDPEKALQMEALIRQMQAEKDSIGGIVSCLITGVPAGVGNPIFGKLQGVLAAAMLSINACKGFDYGCGFRHIDQRGSELNDAFYVQNEAIATRTNFSGGLQGGISNGMPIYFRAAFKPTASIGKPQQTVDVHGQARDITIDGRHDPCIVPRAVPVVEAMAALAVADCLLASSKS